MMEKLGKEKPLLLLFDDRALVYCVFHALLPLTQSKTGEMISAVYGFANTLLKVFGSIVSSAITTNHQLANQPTSYYLPADFVS